MKIENHFTVEDIENLCGQLTTGQIFVITATEDQLPRVLRIFKKKKRDIRITFHRDVENEYYYVSIDYTNELERRIGRIKEIVVRS